MRTLFFDIDGTLLLARGAGKRALIAAVENEFDVASVRCDLSFGGKTDRDLVGQLLRANQIDPTAENQGRLRRRYSTTLRSVLRDHCGDASPEECVLPGVVELLEQLRRLPQLQLAVMTGNFPETARVKLEVFGLTDYFAWVVGGDLDVVRTDMARRAADQLGRRFGAGANRRAVVIGDTLHDIECAKAIDAASLGVCTGSGTHQQLCQAGADKVVRDLADREALEFLSAGATPPDRS